MSRRISRNNNYSSGMRPSGIFRATVTAVNGSLVNVKIPRLGLDNIYEDCPVVGPTPSVNDNIFVGFLEGKTSSPVALTSTDANTGDIDSVIAGTALSGGGSSGDVTLNFAPSELSSATVSTSDKIVIADADDSDNPKTVTVQSIVDLSPGDITGVTAGTGISGGGTSGSVTLNFAPSELSSVTVASDDKVVIADTSDSDNPKHVTAQSIANLAASTPGGSTSQIQYNNSGSFAGSANFTFDGTSTITLTDTDAGSEAAPIIELYRNSASPADSDYLGQIKFQGENDADQKVVYAKITGKIDDASDTTEDGILEVMLQKAGSNNIAMRFNSTTMKLINGTGIEVNGSGQFDSTVTIDGDLTVDTDTLFVDVSEDRVGIGTTTPQQVLDIAADGPRLRLTDTDTALSDDELSSAIEFFSSDASGTGVAAYIHADGSGSTGNLQLHIGTGTPGGAADRVTIAADGKVGIGTGSPAEELDVVGDVQISSRLGIGSGIAAELDIKGASNPEIRLQSTDSSDPFLYFGDQDDAVRGGIGMDTSENALLLRGYNNSTRMTIDSSGNVGINDTTPSYQLDVNGDIRSTADIYANDELYVGANGGGDSPIHFYDDNSNGWRTFRWDDSGNEFIAEQQNGSSYPIWTQYRFRGGSANVAVNSSGFGTVAHGLPSTPSFAFVTSYTKLSSDNDNQLAFPVTGVDSTNITFRAYEINGNGNSNYTSSTIYSATVYIYFLAAVM